MKNIKSFNEYSRSYVWEPARIPSEKQYMPDKKNIKLYKKSVTDAITELLKNIYKLSDNDINKFKNKIWTTYFKEWKDIFIDSLVNWDTPEQCAQKAINKIKIFTNLT